MKNALIVKTKGIFVDDIVNTLNNKNFNVFIFGEKRETLSCLKEFVLMSDLCIIVTTIDEHAIINDHDTMFIRQRSAPDSVFFSGFVSGVISSGAINSKIVIFKRSAIDHPMMFNIMPEVLSLIDLESFIDRSFFVNC